MWYLISNAISGNLEAVLGAGLPESEASIVWAICLCEVVLSLCVAAGIVGFFLVVFQLFRSRDGLPPNWVIFASMLATGALALLLPVFEDAAKAVIDEYRIEEPPATWVALAERFEELPELPPEDTATYMVTDREAGVTYAAVVAEGGADVQLTYLGSADEQEEGRG